MPILPLDQYPRAAWPVLIIDVMLDPDQTTGQRLFKSMWRGAEVMAAERREGDRNLSPEFARDFLHRAIRASKQERTTDVLKDLRAKHQTATLWRGPVSGLVLLLTLARHHEGFPAAIVGSSAAASVNSVLRDVRALLQPAIKRGAGETEIKSSWRAYASVAHLWAGLHSWNWAKIVSDHELMDDWLAGAEDLRRQGESYRPGKARAPLLDPDRTWRLPASMNLPQTKYPLPSSDSIIEGLQKLKGAA
jgi:hypothetical protein